MTQNAKSSVDIFHTICLKKAVSVHKVQKNEIITCFICYALALHSKLKRNCILENQMTIEYVFKTDN